MQGCQQLCGEAPQAAPLSGESSGIAADPDACSARDDEPSGASWACRGWRTPTPSQLTVSQTKIRCLALEARMWCGKILMWPQTRRIPSSTASLGSGILVTAFPCID
ncbi:thimet oligopeptidase [Trypanosoma cruzi]|nr:thimet oligopeptidase [Trypanosoma cruzi]